MLDAFVRTQTQGSSDVISRVETQNGRPPLLNSTHISTGLATAILEKAGDLVVRRVFGRNGSQLSSELFTM